MKSTDLYIHLEADQDLKNELLGNDYMETFPTSIAFRYKHEHLVFEDRKVYINPSLVCVQKDSIVVLALRVGDRDSEGFFNYLSTIPLVSENRFVFAHNPDIFDNPIINEKSVGGRKIVFYEGAFDPFLRFLIATARESESGLLVRKSLTLDSLVRPDPRVDLEFRLDEFSGEEWFSDIVAFLKKDAHKLEMYEGISNFGMKTMDLLNGKTDKITLKFEIKPFEILQTECSFMLASRLAGGLVEVAKMRDFNPYIDNLAGSKATEFTPLGFISKYSAYELCETLTEASESETQFRAPRISEVFTLLYGTRERIRHTLDVYNDGTMAYRLSGHPIYSNTEKLKYGKMIRQQMLDLSIVHGRISPDLLYGFFELCPEWIHEAFVEEWERPMSKEDKRWAVHPEKDSSGNIKETNIDELLRFASLISIFEVYSRIFKTADRFTKNKLLSEIRGESLSLLKNPYRRHIPYHSISPFKRSSVGLVFGNGIGMFPYQSELIDLDASKLSKALNLIFDKRNPLTFCIPYSARKAGNIRFTRDI